LPTTELKYLKKYNTQNEDILPIVSKTVGIKLKTTRLARMVDERTISLDECIEKGLCRWCGERQATCNLNNRCDRCWFYNNHEHDNLEYEEPSKPIEINVPER
jgi:hypothetical protein